MTEPPPQLLEAPPVRVARAALEPLGEAAYVVGGTVRDAILGRSLADVDLAVAGDPERAARAIARAVDGPVFPLSEAFGAWRAIDRRRGHEWDVSPLDAEGIEADLARRDFTVNAMAVPLAGGDFVDPHGGRADAEAGRLRVLGAAAYADDPLRPLRLARLATELNLRPDAETELLTLAAAPNVTAASPERVFAELRRIVAADRVLDGVDLCDRLGLTAAVLPELEALRGVEQSRYHHLDVHGHTIEVLRRQLELERGGLEDVFGDAAGTLRTVLAEPLGDGLTRMQALRLAALLHDVAKPQTRGLRPDGRVTFIGHDSVGYDVVSAICRRLRTSERLRALLAGITRTHLGLGFLVRERPLPRRTVYRYLRWCEPVEVEVTVLSCADRMATRGRKAEPAIAAHLEVARELMPAALEWRTHGPPPPPVRGDELVRELGIDPGPRIGELLAELREACFAGEVRTRSEAMAYARESLAGHGRPGGRL